MDGREAEFCDLTLRQKMVQWFYARLEQVTEWSCLMSLQGAMGETHAIHMAVTDITDWKLAE